MDMKTNPEYSGSLTFSGVAFFGYPIISYSFLLVKTFIKKILVKLFWDKFYKEVINE